MIVGSAVALGVTAWGLSTFRVVADEKPLPGDIRSLVIDARDVPAAIRLTTDGDATEPCIIAGPTCDSVDVLYEKEPYELPVSLAIGSKVLIEGTGAYTTTYSAVGFNGFPPLKSYVI